MSITVVNEWRFLEDADLDEGNQVIREYVEFLKTNESELEQSLWLKTEDDPLHFFHISTYQTSDALDRQKESEGTKRFVERLYPLIDEESLKQPFGPVVVNTGKGPGEV